MRQRKRHLVVDLLIVLLSIAVALWIVRIGLVHTFIARFSEFDALGAFLAGMLFTSVFTTAPSIVILGELAQTTSLFTVTLWGGLGAVLGDYVLFHFMRDRFADDIRFLIKSSGIKRLPAIFKARLFRTLTIFIGALIIASPIPDEVGLTMLGMSKLDTKFFLPISFLMNTLGILAIGLVARAVAF